MRSRIALKVVLGMVFAASAGCGSGSTEPTHLADLPPPSEEEIAKAKAKAKTVVFPKTRFSSAGMSKAEKAATPALQP